MSKQKTTIVIADDHPIMLSGIAQELEQAGYTIVGTAGNGAKALELVVSLQPNIALLDIEMPLLSGYEVVEKSKPICANTRYIIMTYHKERGFVVQSKKLGVHGFLLKEDGIETIEKCIASVLNNQTFFSHSFPENVEDMVEGELKKIKLLSPTERSIIRLIAQNKTSAQIAEILLISIRTVQKHRTNIISKLNLSGSATPIESWIKEHFEIIKTL